MRMRSTLGIFNNISNAYTSNPYSLVYGVEIVLPLEHQIPLLRIIIHEGLIDEDKVKLSSRVRNTRQKAA